MAKNEPQSYGSQGDWVSGDVGQTVNRQKGNPNSQHGDFYESRHGAEESIDHQGGKVSPEQLADNAQLAGDGRGDDQPVTNVTDNATGTKVGSYFKDRDYND